MSHNWFKSSKNVSPHIQVHLMTHARAEWPPNVIKRHSQTLACAETCYILCMEYAYTLGNVCIKNI